MVGGVLGVDVGVGVVGVGVGVGVLVWVCWCGCVGGKVVCVRMGVCVDHGG